MGKVLRNQEVYLTCKKTHYVHLDVTFGKFTKHNFPCNKEMANVGTEI